MRLRPSPSNSFGVAIGILLPSYPKSSRCHSVYSAAHTEHRLEKAATIHPGNVKEQDPTPDRPRTTDQILPLIEQHRAEIDVSRAERLAGRPSLDDLFTDVRDKSTRNEMIHQAMRIHAYSLKELSRHLGLHSSTISVIATRVDKERKDQE